MSLRRSKIHAKPNIGARASKRSAPTTQSTTTVKSSVESLKESHHVTDKETTLTSLSDSSKEISTNVARSRENQNETKKTETEESGSKGKTTPSRKDKTVNSDNISPAKSAEPAVAKPISTTRRSFAKARPNLTEASRLKSRVTTQASVHTTPTPAPVPIPPALSDPTPPHSEPIQQRSSSTYEGEVDNVDNSLVICEETVVETCDIIEDGGVAGGDDVNNIDEAETTDSDVIKTPKPKKIKKVIPKITAPRDQPPNKFTMKMSDLIHWNPVANPMKLKETPKIRPPKLPVALDDEPPSHTMDQDDMPVPQIKIGADGNIIVNEASLVVQTSEPVVNESELGEAIMEEEESNTNYYSFGKNMRTKNWSKEETEKFYWALRRVGTDFSLMTKIFPRRTRAEIKGKFKKEDRKNRFAVENALDGERLQFSMDTFNKPFVPKEKKPPVPKVPKPRVFKKRKQHYYEDTETLTAVDNRENIEEDEETNVDEIDPNDDDTHRTIAKIDVPHESDDEEERILESMVKTTRYGRKPKRPLGPDNFIKNHKKQKPEVRLGNDNPNIIDITMSNDVDNNIHAINNLLDNDPNHETVNVDIISADNSLVMGSDNSYVEAHEGEEFNTDNLTRNEYLVQVEDQPVNTTKLPSSTSTIISDYTESVLQNANTNVQQTDIANSQTGIPDNTTNLDNTLTGILDNTQTQTRDNKQSGNLAQSQTPNADSTQTGNPVTLQSGNSDNPDDLQTPKATKPLDVNQLRNIAASPGSQLILVKQPSKDGSKDSVVHVYMLSPPHRAAGLMSPPLSTERVVERGPPKTYASRGATTKWSTEAQKSTTPESGQQSQKSGSSITPQGGQQSHKSGGSTTPQTVRLTRLEGNTQNNLQRIQQIGVQGSNSLITQLNNRSECPNFTTPLTGQGTSQIAMKAATFSQAIIDAIPSKKQTTKKQTPKQLSRVVSSTTPRAIAKKQTAKQDEQTQEYNDSVNKQVNSILQIVRSKHNAPNFIPKQPSKTSTNLTPKGQSETSKKSTSKEPSQSSQNLTQSIDLNADLNSQSVDLNVDLNQQNMSSYTAPNGKQYSQAAGVPHITRSSSNFTQSATNLGNTPNINFVPRNPSPSTNNKNFTTLDNFRTPSPSYNKTTSNQNHGNKSSTNKNNKNITQNYNSPIDTNNSTNQLTYTSPSTNKKFMTLKPVRTLKTTTTTDQATRPENSRNIPNYHTKNFGASIQQLSASIFDSIPSSNRLHLQSLSSPTYESNFQSPPSRTYATIKSPRSESVSKDTDPSPS